VHGINGRSTTRNRKGKMKKEESMRNVVHWSISIENLMREKAKNLVNQKRQLNQMRLRTLSTSTTKTSQLQTMMMKNMTWYTRRLKNKHVIEEIDW